MGRENQRVQLTKRLLWESLRDLLKERPLERISVAELCRGAGINRSTFYRHYDTPRDVLEDAHESMLNEMERRFDQCVPEAQLRESIEAQVIFVQKNAALMRLFINYVAEKDFPDRVEQLFVNFFEKNIVLPDWVRDNPESKRLLYAFYSGGAYCFLREMLAGDEMQSPAEISAISCYLLRRERWEPS